MTYSSLDTQLTGRCQRGRKVGNNTYAERRGDDIAIKYHATDVVTFHPDGSFTLNSGGWLTYTTKERFNTHTPARVWSDRGRWKVAWQGETYLFADGMRLFPDGTVSGAMGEAAAKMQDRANAKVRNDVKRYLDSITPDKVMKAWESPTGDCLFCQVAYSNPDHPCGHIADHVAERYFMATLSFAAFRARGYRDPAFHMQLAYDEAKRGRVSDLLIESLRKFLVKNLTEGVSTR